jgi:CRISPR-associated protein Cas2
MKHERYMWLLVFFDLPVKSRRARRAAANFRNGLLKDGFIMLQYSVYGRPVKMDDSIEKHLSRIKEMTPSRGSVKAIPITDQQFGRIQILTGKRSAQEEKIGSKQLILL